MDAGAAIAIGISVIGLGVSIAALRRGGIAELKARVTELPTIESAFYGYMMVEVKNIGSQTAHKVSARIESDPEHAEARGEDPTQTTDSPRRLVANDTTTIQAAGIVDPHLVKDRVKVFWSDSQGRHSTPASSPTDPLTQIW